MSGTPVTCPGCGAVLAPAAGAPACRSCPQCAQPISDSVVVPTLEYLLADQRQRHQRGEPAPIEAYLEQEASLADQPEALLDLIYQEVMLREEQGERPALGDYLARFPHLERQLQVLFEVERALEDEAAEATADLDNASPALARSGEETRTGLDQPAAVAPTSTERRDGQQRYRILHSHARGGLGEVFLAQDEELQRQVALKEIQEQHADNSDSRSRFLLEAEITGRLEHPGIVPIYGLGRHADGRPFYAMRFIKGESLKQAIKRFHQASGGREPPEDDPQGAHAPRSPGESQLELRQLLRRFQDVCNTLAYAHSKGVIHRDLKPENIMLGPYGETLVVDWGLAKAGVERPVVGQPVRNSASSASAAETCVLAPAEVGLTATGAILGTPAYMSPEQASGRLNELGPASDVYSLGATLYCLLTGKAPFDRETDLVLLLEKVRSGEVLRPREVNPAVPPALEAVCLKAMALQPEARYASTADLGKDVERWLADEPVSAQRESLRQRWGRWLRRHRSVAQTGVAALVVIALVAVAAFVLVDQAREKAVGLAEANKNLARQEKAAAFKAQRAEQKARDEAETALAVSQFLGGLFDDVDPVARTGRMFGAHKRGGGALTTLEVVNRGAMKLKTALRDEPQVRAALLERIGNVYLSLEKSQEAEPLLREALQLRRQHLGPDHLLVAASLQSLGLLHLSRGEMEAASPLLEQALALRQKHLGPEHLLVADTLFHLSVQRLILYEFAEAEQFAKTCLAIRRRLAPESRDVGTALLVLAQIHILNEKTAQAVPALTEAASILDKAEGNKDFSSIAAQVVQGQIANSLGDSATAIRLFTEALTRGTRLLGEDHHFVAFARCYLAEIHELRNEHAIAASLFRQAVETFRKSFGPESPYVANKLTDLARMEDTLGHHSEAEALAREAVRIHGKRNYKHAGLQNSHIWSLRVLASMRMGRGDLVEAESLYRAALVISLRQPQSVFLAHRVAELLLALEKTPAPGSFLTSREPRGRPKHDLVLARTWAQASQAFLRRQQPLSADDQLVLSFLHQQAVVCLRSAVVSGYRKLKEIEADGNLEPLHGRADFQQLVRELKEKTPDQWPPPVPEPTRYRLVAADARVLDLKASATQDGAPVILYKEHGDLNQHWEVEVYGKHKKITSCSSGKTVEVLRGSKEPGATLVHWGFRGEPHQLWEFREVKPGRYKLVNGWSGLVLEPGPGETVVQAADSGKDNQLWQLLETE